MKVLKISKNLEKAIEEATEFIKKEKVIVCPTDTVYGLIADAKNKRAVNKIFKIKKRKKENPIPIFVKDLKMAKKIAFINKRQEKFLKKIWPGKVTVILKAKDKDFPKGIIKDGKIGIRIPKHKFLDRLLKKLKMPLAQTSANISGNPTPQNVQGILKEFKDKKFQPDLILDEGKLGKKPSVVLDLTQEPPKVLRF
jgi:L-threonylcarbamoyladenylate synthase